MWRHTQWIINKSSSIFVDDLFSEISISRLRDLRDEFDEFQEGSRELEAELEAQLEQYEQRVKDLVSTKSSLEEENEILKVSS